MRKFTCLFAVFALMFTSLGLYAQAPNVGVQSQATAAVSHGPGLNATFGFHNTVTITARHADGTVFAERKVHNLVTNGGFTYIEGQISGTPGAAAVYIGLANDTSNANVGTVAATDTTLATSGTGSTEITAAGFWNGGTARWAGTFTADSPGAKQYTVVKVITATATQACNKVGLFTATTAGTMVYEALFTQVTVNNTDTLTVTWTVTLS